MHNRPDQTNSLLAGSLRTRQNVAKDEGHKRSEAMRQPSGNLISNTLEETATNSVSRIMSLKVTEVSHDKTRTHGQATVPSLCSVSLELSDMSDGARHGTQIFSIPLLGLDRLGNKAEAVLR